MDMDDNYKHFKEEDSFQEHHADLKWPSANIHCPSSDMLESIVRKHALAVEELTEAQLVKVMRQMIASGDITRHVHKDAQSITYDPYRDVCRLQNKIGDLEAFIAENIED